MLLIFPYIFNQRAIKHSKCLAFVSSEFLTGVDTAEKNTAVRTLEGNSCYFLLKTFLKNSNRYWPESWAKNNGRISITIIYSTGQQRCNSTMRNGVSILFRDWDTWIIFLFCYIAFQQDLSYNTASSLREGANNYNSGWGHWLAKATCCLDTWDFLKKSKMCHLLTAHS